MKLHKVAGYALLLLICFFAVTGFYYRENIIAKLRMIMPFRNVHRPQMASASDRFAGSAVDKHNSSNKLAMTPWPMFRHDPMHTGRSPYKGPELPDFQWEFPTKGLIESSASVGPDGTIYIGSHDFHLYAFTKTGTLKWKFPTLGFIRSSPAVASDGTIYFGSMDGRLYALTTEGNLKWSFFAGNRVLSSPTIMRDGTILITSSGKLLPVTARKNGIIYAVSEKGELIWKKVLEGGVSVSSPSVTPDGTIYQVTYPGVLYALDNRGTTKWKIKLKKTRGIRTTPAVSEDGTIYIGARSGMFYAVNPDGSIKWTFETDGDIRSSAAIAYDGTVHFGSYDTYFYALEPDGDLKWKFKTRGPIEVSPCVDKDGVVYFSSLADQSYAVNADGSLKWSFRRGFIYTSPIIGTHGIIYDSGDTAVRAVGPLFPSVKLTSSDTGIHLTILNHSGAERSVVLKTWAADESGDKDVFLSEEVSIAAKSQWDRAVPYDFGDTVLIGARLIDSLDGETLSEKLLFIE